MTNSNVPAKVEKIKKILSVDSVKEQFQNSLKENSGAFIASVIDLYNSDTYLQECDPSKVVMEALKAATLKLPINKQLGFAYVVPYKKKVGKETESIPQFQLGYKGLIQLAMRTGQYRYLNVGVVYEGVEVEEDLLTGQITFSGRKKSSKVEGYFAYMELLNGFSKTLHMSKDDIEAHAKRYSKSYSYSSSAWQSNFDEMAEKTVLRLLLGKFGVMSTEMVTAFTADTEHNETSGVQEEIAQEANSKTIDIQPEYDLGSREDMYDKADKEQPVNDKAPF